MGIMIRTGVLTPHGAPGPEVEFAAMAPGRLATRVVRVTAEASGRLPSAAALDELTAATAAPVLERAAGQLLTGPADVIGYASATSAYAIGFGAEMTMTARLSRLTGRPVAATCASAVHALRVLRLERVALIGAPWFDPKFSELGAACFASRGSDVVSSEPAGLPHGPAAIEPAAVAGWISRHVADCAQAIFTGGNGFRAAAAIQALEAATGHLVLTSNQVLLWRLLAGADDSFVIEGYGRLFTHKP